MKKIIFASHNKHKLSEIQKLTSGLPLEICSLSDIGWNKEIPEEFNTFEENALQKALTVFRETGMSCFSEDSGLEVEALEGKPGVYSARFSKQAYPDIHPSQRDFYNNLHLLDLMKEKSNRNAQYRAVICFVDGNEHHFFEGIVKGKLTYNPIGDKGFGYDPLFIPDGFQVTFAQMTQEQKNKLSHRARAIEKFIDFLVHKNVNI